MFRRKSEDLTKHPKSASEVPENRCISAFFSPVPLDDCQPSLIHFSSTPLFRLEKCPEKYAHLLKKKDVEYIGPIVNYFISKSGHIVYLGGDVVKNLYLHGKKNYKVLNLLAILTSQDVDKYSSIMNSIISSNDGAFSMCFKYQVKKNRSDGCFKDIALARYIIEPRLEGPEKLLYPFRSSTIELDLTSQHRFYLAFGLEGK
jgi:hypothetical protein